MAGLRNRFQGLVNTSPVSTGLGGVRKLSQLDWELKIGGDDWKLKVDYWKWDIEGWVLNISN